MKFPLLKKIICLFFITFQGATLFSQEGVLIQGQVISKHKNSPISGASISRENNSNMYATDDLGNFEFSVKQQESFILTITYNDYQVKRILLEVGDVNINLGVIYLELDIQLEQTDNLIALTDAELFDDEISSNSSGLLQATRDVFLTKAAFDFGQAFFKVRGYDSKNAEVLINGISLNKFYDGRPQWNNFGGLNDVTRNQQFTNGLEASEYSFGGVLGVTNIDTRPSQMRSGLRISSSASNRTYGGRFMATYTTPLSEKGVAYSISGSRRWSNEGYVDGTLYDAYAFFGTIEYQFDSKNSIHLTGILASNRRGRSSAVTEEVFELVGNTYNPYWGLQNGKIRNSRERKIAEPIVMANYYFDAKKVNFKVGIAYQTGINSKSRLGYYNAPNPDPTYYRYLPSFYINSPIGANFESANTAISIPQIQKKKQLMFCMMM